MGREGRWLAWNQPLAGYGSFLCQLSFCFWFGNANFFSSSFAPLALIALSFSLRQKWNISHPMIWLSRERDVLWRMTHDKDLTAVKPNVISSLRGFCGDHLFSYYSKIWRGDWKCKINCYEPFDAKLWVTILSLSIVRNGCLRNLVREKIKTEAAQSVMRTRTNPAVGKRLHVT